MRLVVPRTCMTCSSSTQPQPYSRYDHIHMQSKRQRKNMDSISL